MNIQLRLLSCSMTALVTLFASPAFADCGSLPNLVQLRSALIGSITPSSGANGGLGFNMWGTIVDRDGTVCAVAFSGGQFTSQWLGSRVISAQKANTANDFSLGHNATPGASLFPTGLALSTANLFSAVQPGGSLYGLQHSNPVDTGAAYGNQPSFSGITQANFSSAPVNSQAFGTTSDPMVGKRIGGVNVFGGGLGLYKDGQRVGGLGVSGDTSCTDHMVAWRTRHTLGFDELQGVGGVADTNHPDNIVFDITPNPEGGVGLSTSGFGHPKCLNNPTAAAVSGLPAVR
jgi:hypothetical protein